jgi:very-short-patch-repair endonuclease
MRSASSANLKLQARLELFARQHRCAPTESEAVLWSALKARQLGVSFRRQVLVAGHFIADFLAPCTGLIVEVDGGIHARRQDLHDDRSDPHCRSKAYKPAPTWAPAKRATSRKSSSLKSSPA